MGAEKPVSVSEQLVDAGVDIAADRVAAEPLDAGTGQALGKPLELLPVGLGEPAGAVGTALPFLPDLGGGADRPAAASRRD